MVIQRVVSSWRWCSASSKLMRTLHTAPLQMAATDREGSARAEKANAKRAQIVPAPARPDIVGRRSVFLAGTASRAAPDWRETLIEAISHLPITIYNPLRADWDSSWREDVTFAPFREQVEWELDMQEKADVVVVYYGPHTDAPISLLELGLCARSGKAIVACHRDYKKRGNVHIVSLRLGVDFMDADDDFVSFVSRRLHQLLDETS